MTIETIKHSGAIKISNIINGYLVTKVYYGYTKKQAKQLYKQENN